MAAEVRQAFPDSDIRLIPSSGGVFDVKVDGKLVFSKKASRRHAEPGEVVKLMRDTMPPQGPGAAPSR